MSINDVTIGQLMSLKELFGIGKDQNAGLQTHVGKKCVIRTYSAGVWFGKIEEKSGKEVIVSNARRLWRWHTKKSISLSAIANGDIDLTKCRFPAAVSEVWLEAIETIPATDTAIKLIEGAKEDVAD